MLDTQGISDFEGGFATLLDALDKLRALPAPTERDGLEAFAKWHDEVKKILAQVPDLPDESPLQDFAEDVERAISDLETKARAALATEKRYPRDDGILETPKWYWARLKTEGDPAVYTARRLKVDGANDANVEAPDLVNVKEVNGVTGLAVGEDGVVVRIERNEVDDPAEWRFEYDPGIDGFWGKLDYASESPWFVELELDATTVKEGGREGNAQEVNGVGDIPADTVVWIRPVPGTDPAEYRFAYEPGLRAGDADGQIKSWNDATGEWENILPPEAVAHTADLSAVVHWITGVKTDRAGRVVQVQGQRPSPPGGFAWYDLDGNPV